MRPSEIGISGPGNAMVNVPLKIAGVTALFARLVAASEGLYMDPEAATEAREALRERGWLVVHTATSYNGGAA